MSDGNSGAQFNKPGKKSIRQWWRHFIGYIKRKTHEYVAKKNEKDDPNRAPLRTLRATERMARFTVVLAVVGIVSVFILEQQLCQMKRSDILATRAWVAPITTAIRSEPGKSDGGTIFVVPYSNSGKTPAYNVKSWINRTDSLEKIGDKDPVGKVGNMLLAPKSVGNTSTADIPITLADVKHIKAGTLTVYVYGTISYKDIFGGSHWTQFCFYPGQDLKSFGPCGKHNTTDDNQQP